MRKSKYDKINELILKRIYKWEYFYYISLDPLVLCDKKLKRCKKALLPSSLIKRLYSINRYNKTDRRSMYSILRNVKQSPDFSTNIIVALKLLDYVNSEFNINASIENYTGSWHIYVSKDFDFNGKSIYILKESDHVPIEQIPLQICICLIKLISTRKWKEINRIISYMNITTS